MTGIVGQEKPGAVVVAVATFRRLPELRRLLDTLRGQTRRPDAVHVADNDADVAVRALLGEYSDLNTSWHPLPDNPGCGAGLRRIEEHLLEHRAEDFGLLVVLDDDAVPPSEFIEKMQAAILAHQLDLLAPLVVDESGNLWAPPEPQEPGLRDIIRECATQETALARLGDRPLKLCWCAGTAVAVTAEALRKYGLHRSDFWLLGEDMDFSMRLARGGAACFTCDLAVRHLPPAPVAGTAPGVERRAHMKKFAALLQNLSYLAFHEPYSFHLKRYLPGNFLRWFHTFGWGLGSVSVAARCFLAGAVRGEPAGEPSGVALRAKLS